MPERVVHIGYADPEKTDSVKFEVIEVSHMGEGDRLVPEGLKMRLTHPPTTTEFYLGQANQATAAVWNSFRYYLAASLIKGSIGATMVFDGGIRLLPLKFTPECIPPTLEMITGGIIGFSALYSIIARAELCQSAGRVVAEYVDLKVLGATDLAQVRG